MKTFLHGLSLPLLLLASQVGAQDALQDYYGDLINWQQPSGFEVTPIHAGLLPNGNLFFVNSYNYMENPGNNLTDPGFNPEYLFLMEPAPTFSPPPLSVLIQPLLNPPSLRPLFDAQAGTIEFKTLACSGHSLMADGTLFFASGPDATVDLNLYNSGNVLDSLKVDGMSESVTFNPFTNAWTENPNTIVPGPTTGQPRRWYASVTRLADARMLVTGGYEKVHPRYSYNLSIEAFDQGKNAWSLVSDANDTPAGIENPDYTHVFQFPYTDALYADNTPLFPFPYSDAFNIVMMLGGSGEPLFLWMNGQDKFWDRTQNFRPGAREYLDSAAPDKVFPNQGSSSALLPIRLPETSWGYTNGSVINVGGAPGTALGSHIDVYDPGRRAWIPSISMKGPRYHPATVILPDGRILILAGWNDERSADKATAHAEYVDPRNNFALSRGSAYMPETRGYHAVSVLLPDGRVLIGSGNEAGVDERERTDFRYYYPDYMFKTRPEILYAESTMRMAQFSMLVVPHTTKVGEAALVGLGSMTHSFDMNQRHVQLRIFNTNFTMRFVSGAWSPASADQCLDASTPCVDLYVVQPPSSQATAPPGPYMLFILDENRVPSIGTMVKLQ